MPYIIGIVVVIALWLIYKLCSRKDVISLANGDDGLPSCSKFQFLIWTTVVIFSYVAIYVARAERGEWGSISEIPVNLLILMGISGFALVASKGISTYQQQSGGVASTKKPDPKIMRFSYFIGDDDGNPALNKMQMIAWTFIAVIIYSILVVRQIEGTLLPALPDVDESLLVLMGISQGTYLGKKLVTATSPVLRSLSVQTANPGQEIILSGDNLGGKQAGSIIKIAAKDYALYPSEISAWGDNEIKFKLPKGMPANTYNISVTVGGKDSSPLTLAVISP